MTNMLYMFLVFISTLVISYSILFVFTIMNRHSIVDFLKGLGIIVLGLAQFVFCIKLTIKKHISGKNVKKKR